MKVDQGFGSVDASDQCLISFSMLDCKYHIIRIVYHEAECLDAYRDIIFQFVCEKIRHRILREKIHVQDAASIEFIKFVRNHWIPQLMCIRDLERRNEEQTDRLF